MENNKYPHMETFSEAQIKKARGQKGRVIYCQSEGCEEFIDTEENKSGLCRKCLCLTYKSKEYRVYFILGAGTEKVKIGHSWDVKERLSTLQVGSPVKLLVIGSFNGGVDDEKKVHEHLEKYRSHGEWFYLVDEVIDIIELANTKGLDGIRELLKY